MDEHVLVPVDGSEHAEAALEYVRERGPARVTLVHVVVPTNAASYGDEEYFDASGFQEAVTRARERGERLLADYRDDLAADGVDVETVLATGRPAREILAAAEDAGVDHVVMGSRGRSGVGRVLFGSVAESVTRRAAVPVTIVR